MVDPRILKCSRFAFAAALPIREHAYTQRHNGGSTSRAVLRPSDVATQCSQPEWRVTGLPGKSSDSALWKATRKIHVKNSVFTRLFSKH